MKDKGLTQIVEEVQKDSKQFELLYSRIVKKVYYWCFTILKNGSEAEDVMQESMILIYKKIHTLKSPEYFNSWMYRLVTNCCYGYLNKKKDLEFSINEDFDDGFESRFTESRREYLPKEAYDLSETKQIISDIINELPRKQRETIILFYLEELKIDEIADILDCSSGTIKGRLHKGRKNLEMQLSEYQENNKVKLYSVPLLSILALILYEQRETTCRYVDLSYHKSLFRLSWFSKFTTLLPKLTVVVLSGVVCVSAATLFLTSDTNSTGTIEDDFNVCGLNETQSPREDTKSINTKPKGYQLISTVTRDTNLTRGSVKVRIELKKDIDRDEVKILSKDDEVMFDLKNNQIVFQVIENGNYIVYVKSEKLEVNINNIDAYAPELVEVYNHEKYLQLDIKDEKSKIDFENSYLEHNGKEYPIKDSFIVDGKFSGECFIVLTDKDSRTVRYTMNFSEIEEINKQ
ncbi:RNA polymerase sigma factor [Breznakia pachnodae]|uniref:RNA polymerase sigma factor (Sigma-70 family) n=1 Tax=Breznakia pachnodae TaxID=265178 RepID=A0ABU0E5N1_9FIRM|nr:RNA polymerase sigma factor [Breznakia pachnodae]MDQ0362029.1 RNA polymerase sigma factor (sigma-70 family) [Breznakia pachnodae]